MNAALIRAERTMHLRGVLRASYTVTIMQLKLTRAEVAVAFLIWMAEAGVKMAGIYFEPTLQNVEIAWDRVIVKHCAFAMFWVALTLFCIAWFRVHPITRSRWLRGLGWWVLGAVLAVLLLVLYATFVYAVVSGTNWLVSMRSTLAPDLIYTFVKVYAVGLAANAYLFYQRASAEERSRSQLQLRLATTELMLFRSQLQPHFLFNTLNSIASLVRLQRNAVAVEAIGQLSQLLRHVLDVGQRQVMPLSWELQFTQLYIRLQQLRFGERLAVQVDVDDLLGSAAVPVMLLQPLVENAIQHGALLDAQPCRIAIDIRRRGARAAVEIRNPLARTQRMTDGAGVGLANLRARLQALYGAGHDFSHQATADEYVVRVVFPIEEPALAVADAAAP